MYLEALRYATADMKIFPVLGKVPATPRGFKDATSDVGIIEDWWANNAEYGIGIVTGESSGVMVLDVDGEKGRESLSRLSSEHGLIPPTPTARTGGGGWHVYFEHVPGARCSTGIVGEGLDVRADGGYVVAPPSPHRSGRPYSWYEGRELGRIPLAKPPFWLLKISSRGARRKDIKWTLTKSTRNAELTSIAGVQRRIGLHYNEILALLLAVNTERCKPELSKREVRSIAHSACGWDQGEPSFSEDFSSLRDG